MSHDDEIDRVLDDKNEHFYGEELDEEKMERLTKLRDLCVKISGRDKSVIYKAFPFSNRSGNAMVMLDFPSVFFSTDKTVMALLAKAFLYADDFGTTTLGGNLRLTFGIQDMWTEYSYDNE